MKLIDSDNYAASGIEAFFFPGGEPHARIPENFGDALLYLKARTWNDVGLGMMVLDALYAQNVKRRWLFVPYFPGARQDRTDMQTPQTAKYMLSLFWYSANKVYTFDAHSDVVAHKTLNFMPSDLNINGYFDPGYTVIVPDAGAKNRCLSFARAINNSDKLLQCDKKRNFATGKFEGFTMPPLPGPGKYLIVDDICDGGGTFNLLAQEFKKDQYAKDSELSLWVSHGIFSKGVGNIDPIIEDVYTTDSWFRNLVGYPTDHPTLVTLKPLIDRILLTALAQEGF